MEHLLHELKTEIHDHELGVELKGHLHDIIYGVDGLDNLLSIIEQLPHKKCVTFTQKHCKNGNIKILHMTRLDPTSKSNAR